MNKRIITASAAAFVLAFAGVLKADFAPVTWNRDNFSIYTNGANVVDMEALAGEHNYTNTVGSKALGITGNWSSGEDFAEGEFSTINDGGTLTLNTGGAVVTNAFIEADLINAILEAGYDEGGNGETFGEYDANGDVVIKTTATFVPSDSIEDFSAEAGTSDLKFAIYAYADEDASPATTNLVVFHQYWESVTGQPGFVNDVFSNTVSEVDFTQPVLLTITLRQPIAGYADLRLFKVQVAQGNNVETLTSEFGTSNVDPDSEHIAEADGGEWFITVNEASLQNDPLHSLNFKGTGEVSDIQVGFYGEGGSTPEEYTVSWTVENVVVSNTTAGVAATSGDMFEVDTVLTFYPTVGSITNINGVAQDPGLASYAYTVSGDATLVVLAGEEPTLYAVDWTGSENVVVSNATGEISEKFGKFEAGTVLTFYPTVGSITNVTIGGTPVVGFASPYAYTVSGDATLVVLAGEEPTPPTPSVPEWARPTGADQSVVDAYADWAAVHGKSEDLTVDHSAQFLMNVDADVANIVLSIDAIEITAEGTKITIGATGDGTPITIGTTASAVDTYAINGILNVSVASTLGSGWTKKSIPLANLEFVGGKAVVIIPAADGSFIKASVDYTAGETSIHEITP